MNDKFTQNDEITNILNTNFEDESAVDNSVFDDDITDVEVDEEEINRLNDRFFQALNEMNEYNDDTGENKIVTVDDLVTEAEISQFRNILEGFSERGQLSDDAKNITDDEIRELLLNIKMSMNSDPSEDYMSEEERKIYDARTAYIEQKRPEILMSMNKPADFSVDDLDEEEMFQYLSKCVEACEEFDKLNGIK